MTTAAFDPPVRRSAIASAHEALGARWVSDTVHWPTGYGADGRSEAAAVEAGAGLAEIGPFAEWLVRGPGAVAAVRGLIPGLDATDPTGRIVDVGASGSSGASVIAWMLGPDEVLLVGPVEGGQLAATAAGLASEQVSVIEMTGARTTLRLAGPAAPAVLAELCAADTTPATLSPGALVQASMGGVRAFIARADAGAQPGYTIMIARDEARYLWDAIVKIGAAHGLAPVGPAAVAAMDR